MKLNDRVKVVRGRDTGLEGYIAKFDEYTGWAHLRPLAQDPDPARKDLLEGPFSRNELSLVQTGRARTEEPMNVQT